MNLTKLSWLSDSQAISLLSKHVGKKVIYFEVAPSGLAHPGLLRCLLIVEAMRKKLLSIGVDTCTVLRINDRYAHMGNLNVQPSSRETAGRQLVDLPSPVNEAESFIEWSIRDIMNVCQRFKIHFDSVIRVSTLYQDLRFQDLLWSSFFEKQKQVEKIISESTSRAPILFYPKCGGCGRMYCTSVSQSSLGVFYLCELCGYRDRIARDINGGAVTFKWETALSWHFFNAGIDIHGLDQADASLVATRIYSLLFITDPPILFPVNLVFNQEGNVMSKSKKNYIPVSELAQNWGYEKLTQKLLSTPHRRPIVWL